MPLSRQSLSWMSTLEPSRCFHPARCAAIDPNEWLDWRFLPQGFGSQPPGRGNPGMGGLSGPGVPGSSHGPDLTGVGGPDLSGSGDPGMGGLSGPGVPGSSHGPDLTGVGGPDLSGSGDPGMGGLRGRESRVQSRSGSHGHWRSRPQRIRRPGYGRTPTGRVSPRPENSISVMSVGTEGRTASAPSLAPGGRRHRTMRLGLDPRPGWMVAGRNQRPVDLILAGNWACAFRRLPVLRLVRGSWFGIGFGWPLGAVEMR